MKTSHLKTIYKCSFLILLSNNALAQNNTPYTIRKPTSTASVFLVKNNFTLRTESDLKKATSSLKGSKYSYNSKTKVYTWDLRGGILDGKNQRGDGGQNEDQEPLFRAQMSLILKNGFVRNNKNAALFFKPNSGVDKITWLNVGEDAVATMRGAINFTARNCEAINSSKGDKSFQFNEGEGLIVENNYISGGITGMRIGTSGINTPSDTAYVDNNRFYNVDTAHNVESITVKELGPSIYDKVRLQWKMSKGAKRTK